MHLRFVFLLPNKIAQKAASLALPASKLAEHWYIVDNKSLIPHVTIFDFEIKNSTFKKFQSEIERFVKHNMIPTLRLRGFWVNPKDYTLGLSVKKTDELKNFREEFFRFLRLFGEEANHHNWKEYSPHITLTKYKYKNDAGRAMRNLDKVKMDLKPSTVAAVIVNNHGQFQRSSKARNRIIKSF